MVGGVDHERILNKVQPAQRIEHHAHLAVERLDELVDQTAGGRRAHRHEPEIRRLVLESETQELGLVLERCGMSQADYQAEPPVVLAPGAGFGESKCWPPESFATLGDRIAALGNPVADATAGMISFFERYDMSKYAAPGAPLHDPCTVAWLIKPELFSGKDCNVAVETQSELTLGHTAVDFWHVTDRPKNVHWVYQVDSDAFYELLTERLATFGDGS